MLCAGLDPIPERFPAQFSPDAAGCLAFCRQLVDAVAAEVCAFKPQIAHFGALGAENELAELIAYIHQRHPSVPVILDAKRGDIGSTAARYACEAFSRYGADAVTVNPFLGPDSVVPFLEWTDRGVVVLCRTSNPDGGWIQGEASDPEPVYMRIAKAAVGWNTAGNVMLVTGATYPAELARIRTAAPDVPFLVPGIGSQGGDIDAAVAAGLDDQGRGLVVNVSRDIMYASAGEDFAQGALAAARRYKLAINKARERSLRQQAAPRQVSDRYANHLNINRLGSLSFVISITIGGSASAAAWGTLPAFRK
ncbi:MAG: orotidine-5'-phosphate decarboxylase [Gammaproteobacteria bacterium]|nr:orotidine-5'-phosphate decarboxylase [Gammaproteobacteria bacterium]